MSLINWPWLEDLLLRACEVEVEAFGRAHTDEGFFAFCLEYDGLEGALGFSYGARGAVERAISEARAGGAGRPVYPREFELRPAYWSYRNVARQDPEGAWSQAEAILERFRETMRTADRPEVTEFYWLRFEYLAESVLERLRERNAFRHLRQEPEFLAYCMHEQEFLDEVETRLGKLYPEYRPATVELLHEPRIGELLPMACEGRECTSRAVPRRSHLLRCSFCQRWYCSDCGDGHSHPELFERLPFFET